MGFFIVITLLILILLSLSVLTFFIVNRINSQKSTPTPAPTPAPTPTPTPAPAPAPIKCCWNRLTQSCNVDEDCDKGWKENGESKGCINSGDITKTYGKVNCNISQTPQTPPTPQTQPTPPTPPDDRLTGNDLFVLEQRYNNIGQYFGMTTFNRNTNKKSFYANATCPTDNPTNTKDVCYGEVWNFVTGPNRNTNKSQYIEQKTAYWYEINKNGILISFIKSADNTNKDKYIRNGDTIFIKIESWPMTKPGIFHLKNCNSGDMELKQIDNIESQSGNSWYCEAFVIKKVN